MIGIFLKNGVRQCTASTPELAWACERSRNRAMKYYFFPLFIVECVLAEPQYNQGTVKAVIEGTKANTTVIDPLGVKLEPGPSLYENLIRNLATNLAKCF